MKPPFAYLNLPLCQILREVGSLLSAHLNLRNLTIIILEIYEQLTHKSLPSQCQAFIDNDLIHMYL